MRKGFLVGFGAALAAGAVGAADASACARRERVCGYDAPPVAYQYAAPPPAYGYAPPPVAYYAPPPAPVYGYPRGPDYYGAYYGPAAPYGYPAARGCDRDYGVAPPVAYEGYRPAGVWLPLR